MLAGNGSEGIAYYPFHALLGWPTGLTFYALLVLTLNGISGYLLLGLPERTLVCFGDHRCNGHGAVYYSRVVEWAL